jgi:hypothetical protein
MKYTITTSPGHTLSWSTAADGDKHKTDLHGLPENKREPVCVVPRQKYHDLRSVLG